MGNETPPRPDKEPSSIAEEKGLGNFWAELRRRKVVRVALTYAIVAWLIMQVAGLTFEGFGVPIWAFRFVVIMLWLFFPVAIILAWAFELTPDGIKSTRHAREDRLSVSLSENQEWKRNWYTLLFAAAVPTLIFGTLALYFYATQSNSLSSDQADASHQVSTQEKSIAVLPLENMSPDPENAFFADGVHEDILTNLSKIAALDKVISRSSTLKFRDPDRNIRQVGEELGVRYLVEGSVRRVTNQVLVTVQLIDATTDDHVWAENYNRELTDIFAIQAEIAKEIAGRLNAAISTAEIERIEYRPTDNQEAYDYYVRGRESLYSVENVLRSREFFEKALELDPDFVLAHIGMARHYVWMVLHLALSPHQGFPNAEQWLKSAKVLDGEQFEEYWNILGSIRLFYHWDWKAAELAYQRAVAINRKSAIGTLSWYYQIAGNGKKAITLHEEAVELDPFNLLGQRDLAHLYRFSGRYEEAISILQSILDVDPSYSEAHQILGYVYLHMDQPELALECALKTMELQKGKGWSRQDLAMCYILTGNVEQGTQLINQILNEDTDNYNAPLSFVILYANIGDLDQAFSWLEKAFQERNYWLLGLRFDKIYDPLRKDPRFQEFVDRIDYPE